MVNSKFLKIPGRDLVLKTIACTKLSTYSPLTVTIIENK